MTDAELIEDGLRVHQLLRSRRTGWAILKKFCTTYPTMIMIMIMIIMYFVLNAMTSGRCKDIDANWRRIESFVIM
jgi:hypothetical protein